MLVTRVKKSRVVVAPKSRRIGNGRLTDHTQELAKRFLLHLEEIGQGHCSIDKAMLADEANASIRQALEGLLLFHEELCSKSAERKRAEEELLATRMEAERIARFRSEFLARMSHEIRTPMNAILGSTYLLQNSVADSQQLDDLKTIETSGNLLLHIIDEILDITRLEAGHLQLSDEPFDLVAGLEDVMRSFSAQAAAKGLHLALRIDPKMPWILCGDALRIQQVVTNLMGNSIKFTARGGVEVDVETEQVTRHRATFRILVRDTGIGLDEDEEENQRLFEPFVQRDSSNTRAFGGTGLGLSIVRSTVTLMGGTVGARPRHDANGAEFWIQLALPIGTSSDLSPTPLTKTHVSGYQRCILLVGVRAPYRNVLTEQLEAWSLHVVHVDTADQALQVIAEAYNRDHPFFLALIDETLDSSAEDLAQRIVENPSRIDLQVALLVQAGRMRIASQSNTAQRIANVELPIRRGKMLELIAEAWRFHLQNIQHQSGIYATASPSNASAALSDTTADSGPLLLEPPHVLLVEDNPISGAVIERILGGLGCQVERAENGAIAVHRCKETQFDLVFMDCQMPVLDGYEATRIIREHPEPFGAVPIVALTASAMAGDRERCIEAGMDDYMTKPILPAAVQQILARWVHTNVESITARP